MDNRRERYFAREVVCHKPNCSLALAVRLMADNLTGRLPFPPIVHLSPGLVMSSNLHLFREIRHADLKFDDSVLSAGVSSKP